MKKLYQRLKQFNEGLLPEMVQLKYEAMAENAFRFFRGTCHLFYEHLAAAERKQKRKPAVSEICKHSSNYSVKASTWTPFK